MGVKFGTPPPCQISRPSVQRVVPPGRKTSKSALSKLNTGRLALRAMLPVNIEKLIEMWQMEFNVDKCKVVHYGKDSVVKTVLD